MILPSGARITAVKYRAEQIIVKNSFYVNRVYLSILLRVGSIIDK